jgi:hypothetical protein
MPASKFAPALLAVASLFSATALADDYRAQVRLTADRYEGDRTLGANGTWYFDRVTTDALPLAEAAFLERSSYASVAASHFEPDGDFDDADAFSASVGYYAPDTIFFARLGASRVDTGAGGDTAWNGSVGITPFDGLQLTTDFDEGGWDPNVTAKYVGRTGNGHWYLVNARAVDPDAGDLYVSLDVDYFLDLTFKVGAGFNDGLDRWTARAEKFFTPRFAVGGSLYMDDGGDGLSAHVSWRF